MTRALAAYKYIDISVDANIDTSAVTQYRVGGAFEERRDEPFTVVGKIDAIAGFAIHHAKAARFPVRALANYFAQSPVVRILHGGARNFDAVLYALGRPAQRRALISRQRPSRYRWRTPRA